MNNTFTIGRSDLLWNYAATFLQIGAGVVLLPFILRVFPQETMAIWTIFTTIVGLTSLLDFGFNPSFARNVSYVVSGVKELKATGYNIVETHDNDIDYGLFKGLIMTMRWFYLRVAVLLFVLLASAGTYYLYVVLKNYSGDHKEVYIAWAILVALNTYSLYTMYYDSLILGKGLIKRSKQIKIAGQSAYLIAAIVLIVLRFNLIAVVSAQALSIAIIRILSYRTIFTAEFRSLLHSVEASAKKEILGSIYPNAVKLGLTGLGGFLVVRSSTIIGSLFLPLEEIASFGITVQIVTIISSLSSVYFATYQPRIVQYRVQNNTVAIKRLYLNSCCFLFFTFLGGGMTLVFFGEWTLNLIGSRTPLLSKPLMATVLLVYFLETNHGNAGGILLTKNEVPYFRAAMFSGCFTVALMFLFLRYTNIGIWGLILSQGIAQGCYQNWKWPLEVLKDLSAKNEGAICSRV
jgi:O-antigen/teichoic acid export membrane protein